MISLNNWENIKLKEICRFINGDAYKDTDWSNNGVPIVRIQNLNNINKSFNYWAGQIEDRVTIDNNDLLLAWSGTPGTSFGAHIWNRGFALLNQHIFKVIYNQDKVNVFWLRYAINQILKIMIDKSHGAVGLRHVTKPEVENLEILLPPLEEQERIVKIIETKISAVEKAKKACIEQKRIVLELFFSFVQNILYNKNWKIFKLEEISHIIAGQSPNSDTYNFDKIGLPFFQGKADFSFISPIPKVWCSKPLRIAEKNDILLSVRAPVGPTNIASEKCCIGRGLYAIKVNNNINFKFVYFFFKLIEKNLSKMGNGSTFSAITNEDVKTLEINLPPLEEQNSIVNIIESKLIVIEKLKSLIIEQSSYINALYSSILRKAFNGDY
jgi:type I restriction enzyme S subunit